MAANLARFLKELPQRERDDRCMSYLHRPNDDGTTRLAPRLTTRRVTLTLRQAFDLDELPSAYRPSGGVIDSASLTRLLATRWEQPVSVLAKWIVARQVIHFGYHGQLMLPVFQFDLRRLEMRKAVVETIEALHLQNADELAGWFAKPNRLLSGLSPAEAIAEDPSDVLAAARSFRSINHQGT